MAIPGTSLITGLKELVPWDKIIKFTVIFAIIMLMQWVVSKFFGVIPLDYLVALFYHVNIVLYLVLGWFLAPATLIAIQGAFYAFLIVEIADVVKRIFLITK